RASVGTIAFDQGNLRDPLRYSPGDTIAYDPSVECVLDTRRNCDHVPVELIPALEQEKALIGTRLDHAFVGKPLQRPADQRARDPETLRQRGLDQMMPAIELLLEDMGDDLASEQKLALRLLGFRHAPRASL